MNKVIDVSANQGVINWKEVATAGVNHAILRSVCRSGRPDKQFAANLTGCRAAGIGAEVYRYTYAVTPEQAREEAQQVVVLLADQDLVCRVWWDVEDMPTLVPLGREVLTSCIRAAQNVIEAAGLSFGIYTGLSFFRSGYFDTEGFDCPYWIARYPSRGVMELSADPAEKYSPGIGDKQLWGWQYTSNGRVPGINGPVDVSLVYGADATGTPEPVRKKYYLAQVFGGSISAALVSIGEDGSYDRRREIALANGVNGYTGTADQNVRLLELLRSGKLVKP